MGQQTDQLGRTGLGLGFPDPNGKVHSVLIIDQSTAALLAEEYYAPDGTLSEWTDYQPSKIVGKLPDYPLTPQPNSNGSSGASSSGGPAPGLAAPPRRSGSRASLR